MVNALTWARQNDVALRVRSGRHSLEGWSNVDNGIVIDVSELKSVQIDTASRTATVGAGLNQLEVVAALGKKGLAAPTGTEGSVGLSGATLGGGFGLLTRYLGMACDHLTAAEIVVASGADYASAIKVDLQNNLDLLWALRGAGNGNFGIVTSLTYKTAPLKSVAYVQATWKGLNDLYGVFDAWQRTAPFADNRLTSQLEIHKPQIVLFAVLANGSEAEAKELLAPILSVGKPDVSVQVGSWSDIYAGFQIPITNEPANWKFNSQFITEPFPEKAISLIGSFVQDAPSDDSNYFTNAFGGAVKTTEPSGGTAFPHRDVLFYAEPGAGWGTRGIQLRPAAQDQGEIRPPQRPPVRAEHPTLVLTSLAKSGALSFAESATDWSRDDACLLLDADDRSAHARARTSISRRVKLAGWDR